MPTRPPDPESATVTTKTGTVTRKPRKFKMGGGARCEAPRNDGDPCMRAAGWGTDHPGIGRCKHHGGTATSAIAPKQHTAKAAEKIKTRHKNVKGNRTVTMATIKKENRLMGIPIDINPLEGLLWCIRIKAGEVKWLSEKMAELDEADWLQDSLMGKNLHIWARQRDVAISDLARYSKMAIDVGIAERAVRMAEMYGTMIARMLQGVLTDLELTPKQREAAPVIIRKHLEAIENDSPIANAHPLVGGVDPSHDQLQAANG